MINGGGEGPQEASEHEHEEDLRAEKSIAANLCVKHETQEGFTFHNVEGRKEGSKKLEFGTRAHHYHFINYGYR